MAWDFETEPEFQLHLNWMKEFIREEIRPLDMILGNPYDKADSKSQQIAANVRCLVPGIRSGAKYAAADLELRLFRLPERNPLRTTLSDNNGRELLHSC